MEVDLALAELGMLAAVTDARKDYLREREQMANRFRKRDILHRIGFEEGSGTKYKIWDSDQTVPLISLRKPWCRRSASTSRNRHLYSPYEHRSLYQPLSPIEIEGLALATLPTLHQVASPHNKSNPPSPVKSNPILLGVGTPLVRSKSLDNIALCPPEESRKVDTIVESVSNRIGSLQLTTN